MKGQKNYTSKQNTSKTKPTWQSYVKDNYKHAAKQNNQHPMTTLSREYNNLTK
tara:strand:+ start:1483 stop:1641 length:159 start_codon:yes stop_codon:yes gene_type:complete